MNKFEYARIPLNSNYIKFQNEAIRSKTRLIKILVIIFIMLLALCMYFIFELLEERSELAQTMLGLEQAISEQEKVIYLYEQKVKTMSEEIDVLRMENLELVNNYEETVIKAVEKLTGNIINKTIDVVYLEAGNQGRTGMQLVVDVIFNRQGSSRFKAESIEEVLLYPSQFNVLNHLDKINANVKASDNYKLAQEIVYDKLIYGTCLTDEALFFMNPAVARGSWNGKRELVLEHKDHVFYK